MSANILCRDYLFYTDYHPFFRRPCPKGITSQDPRLYRRLDPEKVAERVVDVFLSFDTELRKIVAPLGRSTSLPIGMSDALGINDHAAAERLQISFVV